MGYLLALMSVLLVSAAQLLMKWAMIQFPAVNLSLSFLYGLLFEHPYGLLALFLGLAAYVCSMGCWYFALRRIPLSKAYPLLSLSYVLVWGAAQLIPWLNESYSHMKLLGVGIIFAGLLLIFIPHRNHKA